MKIVLRVVPRSSQNKITPQWDGSFKVNLTAAPVDNKANEALVKLLSEYFDVNKSSIRILRGEKGRRKVVNVKC